MKCSKQWLFALAVVLGCLAPGQAFGQDYADGSAVNSGPTSRRIYAQEVSTTNSWYAAQAPAAAPAPAAAQVPQMPAPVAMDMPCCTGDGGCARPAQVIALVEGTFFWPQFSRNFLTAGFTNGLGTQTFNSNSQLGSTDGSLLVAPRITLGVQGECWGLVGRYWYASSWGSAFTPSNPALAATGNSLFDGFRAYTMDLEAQRRFCWCDWNLYGFGGVRYASLNNNRTMNIENFFGGNTVAATSTAIQNFHGTGLTFGLWGTRPLFDCSPFKLFFANRYSILWGSGGAAAQTFASAQNGIGNANSINGAAASGNGDLFIGEIQLGLQWDACLKCLPGRAFLRSGIEYQYWNSNANVQAASTSIAAVSGGTAVSSNASASAGDFLFSLVGFNIGAGIMY